MTKTVTETTDELHRALRDYIEATYHISNPGLIRLRRSLLQRPGIIFQRPYIESTPRYMLGKKFSDLNIPIAAKQLLNILSEKIDGESRLVFNPPYSHQSRALEAFLSEGKNLMITTGTGSGKTESFLLPMLGLLANEAATRPKSFENAPSVRAMLLYPMNALVNDQLGRLRLLIGSERVKNYFLKASNRPVRFARYTSRTLYPGVRSEKKDSQRLASIKRFYVDKESATASLASKNLVWELKRRGKWPAKESLTTWFGSGRWKGSDGKFKRCIPLLRDSELLTRHEVQDLPPDVLVTNYSMLEYMMMRPIERSIFESTRTWLAEDKKNVFLLIVDEAHLYRGASGTEVALLLRRLRERLGIPADRLKVICTSASFSDPNTAIKFAAELTGHTIHDYECIQGDLLLRDSALLGQSADAIALQGIDLQKLYAAESESERIEAVRSFVDFRETPYEASVSKTLWNALKDYGPLGKLINTTMTQATLVSELGALIFPDCDNLQAEQVVTTLLALGSMAKNTEDEPGLIPCRIHAFFRGLPGLWLCVNTQCSEISESERGGVGGAMYAQPREQCKCGARVFELFTCRNCGTAYVRGYVKDVTDPQFVWSEPGGELRTIEGELGTLQPVDILLESPGKLDSVIPIDLDVMTGRADPLDLGDSSRQVFIRRQVSRADNDDKQPIEPPGKFVPCGVCGQAAGYGKSSVQDHQTKGDQPFQAIVTRQIQVQPPNIVPASAFAPLRGRKVLIFSDSRQTAARLAPNVQTYSQRDALRALIIKGFVKLNTYPVLAKKLNLDDVFSALLIASAELNVRVRPEIRADESFEVQEQIMQAVSSGVMSDEDRLRELIIEDCRSLRKPDALVRDVMKTLTDKHTGVEALALASFQETIRNRSTIENFPQIPGVADTPEEKLSLVRFWIRTWIARNGVILDDALLMLDQGVKKHSGKFEVINSFLGKTKGSKSQFEKEWLPILLNMFCKRLSGDTEWYLSAKNLMLIVEGNWVYCDVCKTAQRPMHNPLHCQSCSSSSCRPLLPSQDEVFLARKGYYRTSTNEALQIPPISPISLIAAEHTAQVNSAQGDEAFSRAEEYELRFQDVDIRAGDNRSDQPAIDVLSCTTTMEVGIDIGNLSGVALRNVPPARSNYQQRAGRAGRRGNAVATVVSFASSDSHDEHFFNNPDEMIRGRVDDPVLSLDNRDIAQRHVLAYLLQRYHGDRLPGISASDSPNLFSVLGSVEDFKGVTATINRNDFVAWLGSNATLLKERLCHWLPNELNKEDRQSLIEDLENWAVIVLDSAIEFNKNAENNENQGTHSGSASSETSDQGEEDEDEDEDEKVTSNESGNSKSAKLSTENLLDRLLYKGVLPRYAFPTDVATFHVFDSGKFSSWRPAFRYTPQQGLSVALSQYAPGKDIWIDGKLWTSGAIYSPVSSDRFDAWEGKRLYLECSECHFAKTVPTTEMERRTTHDCPACGSLGSLGPSRLWIRPPGFAHPVDIEERTSPEDTPDVSYATRAKLSAPSPVDESLWKKVSNGIRAYSTRQHLLVTNNGPKDEGYSYCTKCGRIEASVTNELDLSHRKPFPDDREPNCSGGGLTKGIVLGTDFITDVLILSLRVSDPYSLAPLATNTHIALRTLSEAIAKAGCQILELEAHELQAEFRPALTQLGSHGEEAEIYMYDTLAGGAGFARRVYDQIDRVLKRALEILENCSEDCDKSCYRCLRSFKNKFEHDLLDRKVGAYLLRYLLTGESLPFDIQRIEGSVQMVYEDLLRTGFPKSKLARNKKISVGTKTLTVPMVIESSSGFEVVDVSAPLTAGVPGHKFLDRDELQSAGFSLRVLDDEVRIRRNLPSVTAEFEKPKTNGEGSTCETFTIAFDGSISAFKDGDIKLSFKIPGGAKAIKMHTSALGDLGFPQNSLVVIAEDAHSSSSEDKTKSFFLIARPKKQFRSTGEFWTIAQIAHGGSDCANETVSLRYGSATSVNFRPERIIKDEITILGQVLGTAKV